ncbi:MAG: MoxR family ATPase [Deltaproteobacteria bacterium]|nr:MoxR family ATPase [Candidatus Zymogenaceae bacterium]
MNTYVGTGTYIASSELMDSVNVAIALSRPLLVKGEPGTGKTLLAHSVAENLNKEMIVWNIKSTTKAKDGLYVYDTVQRLNDARFGEGDVSDIKQYIKLGKLGRVFTSDVQVVLLIDEIDKADLEFPNDLLNEMDVMTFHIPETDETITARHRPIVIITSNAEKELPDAFLRRCVFHYIEFPDEALMIDIIRVHYPDIKDELLAAVLKKFYWIRTLDSLRKKPSTSELVDWVRALIVGGISPQQIEETMPFLGALLKKREDYEIIGRQKENQKIYDKYRSQYR